MPKLIDETKKELKPKRAPRKVAEGTRPARKRVPKKPTDEHTISAIPESLENPTKMPNKRKAPTRLEEERVENQRIIDDKKKSLKKLGIVGALLVACFVIAAIIGNSDEGQIDVSAVVAERNARVSAGNINPEIDGDSPTSIVVPVQNSGSQMVDGGLERSVNPPVLESATLTPTDLASSSATSTPEMDLATTTNDVASSSEEADNSDIIATDNIAEELSTATEPEPTQP